MSAAKHTPGPWLHHEGKIHAPGALWIATVVERDDIIDADETEANAALLAAAPELLAALVRAERCIRGYTDSSKRECDLDGIRAAIAKATGSTR
jgi:hypothetical protein